MEDTDFIIIGSGIAGFRAAIELASQGQVVLVTKSRTDESSTEYAQGGIAAAISDEDEIGLHYEDTIRAGDGLCNDTAVRVLVEEGPRRIQELIEWGTQFDHEGLKLAFTREAAHSRRRILHAHGDSTGREINQTLMRKVYALGNLRILPHSNAIRLLVGCEGCEGVCYLEEKTGRTRELRARAVLLATGGLGMIYREMTNPDVATGDGYALAFEAGAALADMEFVQFHPTALKHKGLPHFLLSEALRGEGGQLKNGSGEAFMHRYHPLGDLAPRDVVSRSIFSEALERGEETVFLDLTHLPTTVIRERFPRIHRTCQEFGLDIAKERIPVFPAAHYMMGGIYTDLWCRTTIPNLFAAGEVACNGVHGANRLASNSLLEGLVFGARAGSAMAKETEDFSIPKVVRLARETWQKQYREEENDTRKEEIQNLMSDQVGIIRSGDGLQSALVRLNKIPFSARPLRPSQEGNSLLTNAHLVTLMALFRKESRGAHYRTDYPDRDDAHWRHHVLVHYDHAEKQVIFEGLEDLREEHTATAALRHSS